MMKYMHSVPLFSASFEKVKVVKPSPRVLLEIWCIVLPRKPPVGMAQDGHRAPLEKLLGRGRCGPASPFACPGAFLGSRTSLRTAPRRGWPARNSSARTVRQVRRTTILVSLDRNFRVYMSATASCLQPRSVRLTCQYVSQRPLTTSASEFWASAAHFDTLWCQGFV